MTTTLTQTYMLDSNDTVITDGVDWSWATVLLLVLSLCIALNRWGRSLGMRVVRIRAIARRSPDSVGVPLSPLLIRYAVLAAGFIPGVVVLYLVLQGLLASVSATQPVTSPVLGIVIGPLLVPLWAGWNVVLVARKRDTLYDHVAGTAIVRG